MTELGASAERQLDALLFHYIEKERVEAARNLGAAVREARRRIDRSPGMGFPAPRPYPELARAGERWIKEGRYWFAYSLTDPPVIVAVFFEAADMLGRA